MTTNTRSFTEEEMEENDFPYNSVHSEIVGQRRWVTETESVCLFEGKHYLFCWDAPSTENQEGQDIFDDYPVVATEVELRDVTVKRWLPK